MAGKGPAPKEPAKRARGKRSDPVPLRVVSVSRADQPDLIDLLGDENPVTGEPWLRATLRLWEELAAHPATGTLVAAQWSQLARAMMYDDASTGGMTKLAAEARLRFAKFFIDPDDMMRGRIVAAQADEADEKRGKPAASSRSRYGGSRAVASD